MKYFSLQFGKFALVGGLNTVIHNLIYLSLIHLNINYVYSTIIAFSISLIFSFYLNCYFTYKIKPTLKKFILFPISYLPNLFMQLVGIVFIVEVLRISKYLSGLLSSVIAIPLTYVIMSFILKRNMGGEFSE